MSRRNQGDKSDTSPSSQDHDSVELVASTPGVDSNLSKVNSKGISSPLAETDDELYEAGIPLKDLSNDEIHQFPGLKRERWW